MARELRAAGVRSEISRHDRPGGGSDVEPSKPIGSFRLRRGRWRWLRARDVKSSTAAASLIHETLLPENLVALNRDLRIFSRLPEAIEQLRTHRVLHPEFPSSTQRFELSI